MKLDQYDLTPTEAKLLRYLIQRYPDWCAKSSIQEDLWDTVEGDYDPVANYICRLRAKLGDDVVQTSRFKDQVAYRVTEEAE